MGITIIVGYPLSKLLDCIFGHENGNYYQRPQLKALIDLHGPVDIVEKTMDKHNNADYKNIDLERSDSSQFQIQVFFAKI